MRNALGWGAILIALVGCGSTGGGTRAGGGNNGAAGANGAAGQAGIGGAADGGVEGANGAAGGPGAGALVAGTYGGTASGANCVGFPDLTSACTVQITLSGGGPTYQVTGFMLPGGIAGTGITVTQTGNSVAVDLLTDSTADFCPATEYTGSGAVGAGGSSLSVTLTGPPCGSSDAGFLSATLTKQ